MTRLGQVFVLFCFFFILLPYTVAALYLAATGEPNFKCGFKMYFGNKTCYLQFK